MSVENYTDIIPPNNEAIEKALRLIVYNRFPEKMFETTDMSQGWNGTYKGEDQPMGSYVWVLQMITGNDIAQTSKGVVTLIR